MKLGHIQAFDKFVGLLKVFIRFTTCAHNHIHADKSVGHHFFHFPHFGSEKFRIISPAHQLQHFVTTGLQRNMEMRHETAGMRNEFYDLVSQQIGLYGGNSVALNAFHFIQRLHQIEESFSGSFTEISDIDTRQHNFFSSLGRSLAGLFHHGCNCSVATPPAGERNGAVRAEIIATILYFQKITGTVAT